MRRSSSSIPTNIAEGCGRNSQGELIHFLTLAMGSSSEREYQLILAHDLHYVDETIFTDLSNEHSEIRRMLNAFIQKVKRDNVKKHNDNS